MKNATRSKQYIESGIKFLHNVQGRCTVAYRLTPTEFNNGDDVVPGLKIDVAVSRASPLDNFSRRVGRDVTAGRLLSTKAKVKHRYSFEVEGTEPRSGDEWREFEKMVYLAALNEDGVYIPIELRQRYLPHLVPQREGFDAHALLLSRDNCGIIEPKLDTPEEKHVVEDGDFVDAVLADSGGWAGAVEAEVDRIIAGSAGQS